MTDLEEQFYETAAREVAERRVVPGVMAKAFSLAGGDQNKSVAIYLKLRVRQLAAEHKAAARRVAAEENRCRAAEPAASTQAQETTRECCWTCSHFTSTPAWLDRTKGKCAVHQRKTFAYSRCDDHEWKKT